MSNQSNKSELGEALLADNALDFLPAFNCEFNSDLKFSLRRTKLIQPGLFLDMAERARYIAITESSRALIQSNIDHETVIQQLALIAMQCQRQVKNNAIFLAGGIRPGDPRDLREVLKQAGRLVPSELLTE